MNKLEKQYEDIVSFTEKIILKYFDIKEDRLDIMKDAKAPELLIDFDISKEESYVSFLVGTRNYKHSIPESISLDYPVNFYKIKEIIDYILEDHKHINFNINKNSLDITFRINWSNEAIKGLYCDQIDLNFNFYNNTKLRDSYINSFLKTYFDELKDVPLFKQMKDEFISQCKSSYFSSKNKKQMLELLENISEDELRSLLYKIDDDTFTKYCFEDSDNIDFDVKKLS